jgi:2-(1,2-epoxy-1,2-dihydrophenyl)acetyl-CoA isomerase
MPDQTIRLRASELSLADGVAEFSHQRPERRNSISPDLAADYADLLARVEAGPGIHALIITGSGGSFCAGADLKDFKAALSNAPQDRANAVRATVTAYNAWLARLRHLDVPVIAAVDGAAFGGGASLALAADFVLASTRATFGFSFAKIALVPDMGALQALPRLVGMAAARDLLLTGRRVGAEEARQLGFVHSLYEPERLLDEARRFARRFRGASRRALGATKRLLDRGFETRYEDFVALEADAQAELACADDHLDAVAHFLRGEPVAFDWDRSG